LWFDFLFQAILEMMKQLMNITNEDQILLRSRAIECAGIVAFAVGKEAFAVLSLSHLSSLSHNKHTKHAILFKHIFSEANSNESI
jgi:hypothetical protein